MFTVIYHIIICSWKIDQKWKKFSVWCRCIALHSDFLKTFLLPLGYWYTAVRFLLRLEDMVLHFIFIFCFSQALFLTTCCRLLMHFLFWDLRLRTVNNQNGSCLEKVSEADTKAVFCSNSTFANSHRQFNKIPYICSMWLYYWHMSCVVHSEKPAQTRWIVPSSFGEGKVFHNFLQAWACSKVELTSLKTLG